MLARLVEMHVLPEKVENFRTIANNEILPLLKKNPGFVDWITVTNETTPTRCTSVILFKTRNDVERYEKETYPTIMQKIQPLLTEQPRVQICNVEVSTFHKIFTAKAA